MANWIYMHEDKDNDVKNEYAYLHCAWKSRIQQQNFYPEIGKSCNFDDKCIYDDENNGFQIERILSSYIGGEYLFN